jgi:hypothetical protein
MMKMPLYMGAGYVWWKDDDEYEPEDTLQQETVEDEQS